MDYERCESYMDTDLKRRTPMKEMKENMKTTYKLIVPVAYALGVLTEKIVEKVKEKKVTASKDASR